MLDAVEARGNAFRWQTISTISRFLNRREQTRWELDGSDSGWALTARNPEGLEGTSWFIPAKRYAGVSADQGQLGVMEIVGGWLVTAKGGDSARIGLNAR